MTSFILLASAISIVSLWILARPLLKTRQTSAHQREAQNIHFARERLQEIETQLQDNAISDVEYQALKQEIESNLALDLDIAQGNETVTEPSTDTVKDENNGMLIVLLCLVIPIASGALYLITGTPEAITATEQQIATQQASAMSHEDISEKLTNIEQQLEKNPDDAEGWTVLAQSYLAMGAYDKSIRANQALIKLNGANANVYAQMADAAALKARGDLAGQPSIYIQQALALDPNQPQALWLSGLAAAQLGNGEKAREQWNRLLPLLEGSPKQQDELRQIIQQTIEQESQLALGSENTEPKRTAPESTSIESEPVQSGLKVRIELDESVASLVNGNETVFVFARAKSGPPAPLAVKPLRVSDLPAEIMLTDADAMMAQLKLSLFDNVVVSARIAKSGNPIAQSGDIQSALVETSTKNQDLIRLNISQLLE